MEKHQIESYIRNHGLNYDLFATLVGVKRRSIDWWIQRERWVASGCKGEIVGTGIESWRHKIIQRRTKNEITVEHLHKISSFRKGKNA